VLFTPPIRCYLFEIVQSNLGYLFAIPHFCLLMLKDKVLKLEIKENVFTNIILLYLPLEFIQTFSFGPFPMKPLTNVYQLLEICYSVY